MKISKQAYTVLGYLAYETVAQIMDLALLVRHDQTKIHGDALDRLRLGYCNPATYKPYQHGKVNSCLKFINYLLSILVVVSDNADIDSLQNL